MGYFLTTDEMNTIQIEIAKGTTPEQSSLAPLTERMLGFWKVHESWLIEAQAEGWIVEMPGEWPNLSTYKGPDRV